MNEEELAALERELLEIQAKEKALAEKIKAGKEETRKAEMKKIADQMTASGIGIHELARFIGVPVETQTDTKQPKPKKEPAPPKFLNPETGETHSGRGQLPAWLKDARDAGKLEDFRIK